MDFIRFTIWPWLKVKLIYYWWVIRYGGKKNIPPDLIFKQMLKSMQRMQENLGNAFDLGKDDMTKDEFLEFNDLMKQAENLEKEIGDLN